MTTRRDPRFPYRASRPTARVRLLCLPFAGGTAATYRTWATAMPPWIDVCALELPGHGSRMGTPPKTTMNDLIDAIVADVKDLGLPLAIFGHSMGAIAGFELCRALGTVPLHLFASASPAPDDPPRRRHMHLSRSELISELERWANTPAEVLADEDLMDLLLPIIKADLAIVETYRGQASSPVDVPITALTGDADLDMSPEDARGWSRFTTRASADPIVLTGGHFFLDAHAAEIQQLVARTLEAQLR